MVTINPAELLIEDMDFANRIVGTRIKNILHAQGVETLEQLLVWTEQELLDLRNFGIVSLAELTVKLKRMGLELNKKPTW